MYRYIKKILDDIIDVAYPDSGNRFKRYKLYLNTEEKDNYSGVYFLKDQRIEIYNMSLGARHVAKCCLHELSHHIDYCLHGTTGHQKPFYEAYQKLIYASLNMGILNKGDFDDFWSQDKNKVKRIVAAYKPEPVDYKLPEQRMLKVRNCFDKKESLKQLGYRWNKLEQVWEKEVKKDTDETNKVEELGIDDYEIVTHGLYINAVIYIEASGDTYNSKEQLKKLGFFYDKKNKKWRMKTTIKGKELERLILTLNQSSMFQQKVSFKIQGNRK